MVRALAVTLVVLGAGCGGAGEDPPPEPGPSGCAAGEWPREDGSCVQAGLPPDMPCPPAEWLRDDGLCIPAGVPPDGCGEGFVHDGDRGCEPLLPEEPCPRGLMAVPGETLCREVAPCAPGSWGDIPVEPDTEYVDASYAGMDSDGSALKPWTSIQVAVDAASQGAIVAIASGSYLEDVTVSGKPVRIWGVCPRLVEVVGSGVELAAIAVYGAASGSEVRGLALTGDGLGFVLSGSLDVLVERVWVHENAKAGISVETALGPTRMSLLGALVEQNHRHGVLVLGSEATLEASVVRATQPDAQGIRGVGVSAQADSPTAAPSALWLQRSLVEQNLEVGVHVSASEATLEASVIRTTHLNTQSLFGRGVNAEANPTTRAPSTLWLQRSLVEQSRTTGVFVEGSQATLEASVIRTTQPDAQGLFGRGVNVQSTTGVPSKLWLQRSLVEQNHTTGVFVGASEATLEASVIRTTQPNAQGLFGRGVNVQRSPTGAPSTFWLQRSLVEQNHAIGVFVGGSEATLEASIVRATQPDPQGLGGRGVHVREDEMTGAPSTLLLERSLIEQNHEAGVFVLGSVATIASCLVRDTLPNADGLFGEGVGVWSELGPASLAITATRIDRSVRAAIAAWGAHATVGGSAMSCQAFDLDAETFQGKPATLEDLGGNLCGCPDASGPCKAVSAHLEPPPPLADPEP